MGSGALQWASANPQCGALDGGSSMSPVDFKVTQHSVFTWVNFFQIELMVEICSKSLVRAIDKVVLLIKFS